MNGALFTQSLSLSLFHHDVTYIMLKGPSTPNHRLSSGPYFFYYSYFSPLFFLCSYFSLLFSENAPLSLLFCPKMLEATKNCIVFLARFPCLELKNQIIVSSHNAKVYFFFFTFYFSCISFIGTFILVFSFHGNVVLLFRDNFVCLLYLFLSLKTLRASLLSLLFMFEIPTFALLFQNFEPYFIPTFLTEGA